MIRPLLLSVAISHSESKNPENMFLFCRCKAARYCSEKCQKLDWKKKEAGHKEVCNAVQRGELKPEDVPRLKVTTMVPLHAVNALIPAYMVSPELVLNQV